MGARSELFVFDHRRYVDEVAAALRRWYERDEVEPWLEQIWLRHEQAWLQESARRPTPRLSAELRAALTSLMASADLTVDAWPDIGPYTDGWFAVQMLFERAVITTCWAECVDMGNATFPLMFADCWDLEDWKLPENPYVSPLLETLGRRAGGWRHSVGGFSEGINGWLDPDETWLLADAMGQLPLPHVEPSPDAVYKAAYDPRFGECSDTAQCLGRLAIIGAYATIASRDRHGLLWARSTYPTPD